MRVLVTGGAGFIGCHTVLELLSAGHLVAAVDDLSNGRAESLLRVGEIAGVRPVLHEADIRDRAALRGIFKAGNFDAVVHLAGSKAVAESVREPLSYYDNNVGGATILFETMAEFGVKQLVFSSSATVYGAPDEVPVREDAPLRPANPYGRTKLVIEEMLRDLCASDPAWSVTVLRYFNPAGAHESGRIGEDPSGTPDNLMPYVARVAVGKLKTLSVYGSDYPTRDGTGVRDYIHVVDLALGHVKALERLHPGGIEVVNLGTGRGYSVLEVVAAFEKASGRKIPCVFAPRRSGDVAEYYADPSRALEILGWRAERGLYEMCADAWRWQSENPDGYGGG